MGSPTIRWPAARVVREFRCRRRTARTKLSGMSGFRSKCVRLSVRRGRIETHAKRRDPRDGLPPVRTPLFPRVIHWAAPYGPLASREDARAVDGPPTLSGGRPHVTSGVL